MKEVLVCVKREFLSGYQAIGKCTNTLKDLKRTTDTDIQEIQNENRRTKDRSKGWSSRDSELKGNFFGSSSIHHTQSNVVLTVGAVLLGNFRDLVVRFVIIIN